MARSIDTFRFAPEKAVLDEIFERYGLQAHVEHYLETGEIASFVQRVWSEQLRITDKLSPRLCSLLDQVKERLSFADAVDLFVAQEPVLNAFTIPGLTEECDHVVSLTSALVERMNDDELRFVLGHELGHLAYQHYRVGLVYQAAGKDSDGDSALPPLVQNRLGSWDRLSELSADRAGYIALGDKLEAVVSAFFQLNSGLGPEHLRFDITAFLSQLDSLKGMKRSDVMAGFSHPIIPIRVRALQLFQEAGGASAEQRDLERLDEQVNDLAMLMEREVTEPLDVQARDFLLAGGLLASNSDGHIDEEQTDYLLNRLLPLCADPEAELAKITSVEQAAEMLSQSMEWLRENAGEERFFLYRQLAVIVAMDGRLDPGEKTFMMQAAEGLAIPEKSANEIIHETLRHFIQSQRTSRTPLSFGSR